MSSPRIDSPRTARLTCQPLRPEHLPELSALVLDPLVWPWLWPRAHAPTEQDVREGLARQVAHWERYGFGMWLLRDRRTGEMVGRGGLQWTYVPDELAVEAGWSIIPARWGEGLATELAALALAVGFGPLRLREVVAFALPENGASRRVMEKAGFAYECEIVREGRPHVLYRVRRPPFALRRALHWIRRGR